MSADELGAFLEREAPPMLGLVGTLRRDGSPHVVPVWYRWDGKAVRIWTDAGRGWARNVARDPRVCFTVAEPGPPFAAAVLHGRAEVRTADDEETVAEIRRITRRYIPEADVEEYVSGWPDLRTIVTIRPTTIASWGRGY